MPLDIEEIKENDLYDFFDRAIEFVYNNIKEWSNNEIYMKLNKIYKLLLGDNKIFSNYYKKRNSISDPLFTTNDDKITNINNSLNKTSDNNTSHHNTSHHNIKSADDIKSIDDINNSTDDVNNNININDNQTTINSVNNNNNSIVNSNIIDSNVIDSNIINSNIINSKVVNSNIINSNVIENTKKKINSIDDWTLIGSKKHSKFSSLYANNSNISTNINKSSNNKYIISVKHLNNNKKNLLDKYLIDLEIRS